MKSVNISYFAVLRERSGKSRETRDTEAETLRDLYIELSGLYKFPLDETRVRVAIGESYVDMGQAIEEGMEITFIPPVAGG